MIKFSLNQFDFSVSGRQPIPVNIGRKKNWADKTGMGYKPKMYEEGKGWVDELCWDRGVDANRWMQW